MGALSTGGRTSIEHAITGTGGEQRRHPLGRSILNTPVPIVIPRPTAQITTMTLHLHPLGTAADRMAIDASCTEILHHPVPTGTQRIHPQIQGRHLIAGGRYGFRPLRPPPFPKERGQPVR